MQKKPFTELGLSPEILKAVAKMGFEEASPIQSETIPQLMAGADVVGLSQTGSGKTAAFALPAIERVDASLRAPQVLILCPTRELAMQVAEEVAKLALFKRGVRELPIYGGQSYDRQLRGSREGAQIIIGTPGRVMDHLERKTLRLDQVGMVILDEADRMLDMGFRDDIEKILGQAPAGRQTVFFSATMPPAIQHLVKKFTRNPVNVRIESQEMTVPAIEQIYYEVDRRSKLEVLCRLIDLQDIKYAIIFCGTKMMVDELADHLKARGYSSDKLHGDISQAMRERVVAKFRKRGFEFLVATDVAARGLDVDDIEVVFNYDLPQDAEDYVHRIGRTGRAGRSGRAITFVAGREIWKMQQIIRFTKGKVRRERVPTAEEVEQKRTSAFLETLRETLEKGDYKRQDAVIDQLLDQGYSATDIASALIHLLGGDKPAPQPIVEEQPRREQPRYEPREYPKYEARKPTARKESHAPAERHEKPSRSPRGEPTAVSHEPGMIRLAFNFGNAHQITPGDFVGVIAGITRLSKEVVGRIEILEQQTLVDVSDECANLVLKKLNGIKFKGHRLAVSDRALSACRESANPKHPRAQSMVAAATGELQLSSRSGKAASCLRKDKRGRSPDHPASEPREGRTRWRENASFIATFQPYNSEERVELLEEAFGVFLLLGGELPALGTRGDDALGFQAPLGEQFAELLHQRFVFLEDFREHFLADLPHLAIGGGDHRRAPGVAGEQGHFTAIIAGAQRGHEGITATGLHEDVRFAAEQDEHRSAGGALDDDFLPPAKAQVLGVAEQFFQLRFIEQLQERLLAHAGPGDGHRILARGRRALDLHRADGIGNANAVPLRRVPDIRANPVHDVVEDRFVFEPEFDFVDHRRVGEILEEDLGRRGGEHAGDLHGGA